MFKKYLSQVCRLGAEDLFHKRSEDDSVGGRDSIGSGSAFDAQCNPIADKVPDLGMTLMTGMYIPNSLNYQTPESQAELLGDC